MTLESLEGGKCTSSPTLSIWPVKINLLNASTSRDCRNGAFGMNPISLFASRVPNLILVISKDVRLLAASPGLRNGFNGVALSNRDRGGGKGGTVDDSSPSASSSASVSADSKGSSVGAGS